MTAGQSDPRRRAEKRLLLLTALGILLACLLLNHLVLGNVPHGWDGVAYHFQAQIFASGRVVAPSTSFIEFFWLANVINGYEKRYAKYPPGWPLLLAPAMALGMPELANAALAALCAVLIWLVARRLYDHRTAWLAVGLAAASPFFMFMGSNFLAHMSSATAVAAMLWAMIRAHESLEARSFSLWGLAAAAAATLALLIRPFSASLGIVGSVAITASVVPWRPVRWLRLLLLSLPVAAAGATLLLLYNHATTGHALRMGYYGYNPDFSFLGEAGIHRESLWQSVRINLPKYFNALNTQVWGWPLPDLSLVLVLAALRFRDRRTWMLIAAVTVFVIAHSFYYFFDLYYGPRMIFETMPWLLIASAAGITALWDWASRAGRARSVRLAVAAAVGMNVALGAGIFFPKMALYYSANFCGQGRDLIRIVNEAGLDNAVVFLRTPENFAFANVSHRNTVDLHGSPVLFARYNRERLAAMIAAFPRRKHWILELEYEGRLGLNDYHDRFEITRADWIPLLPE